jgi:hypothetical protein
VQRYKQTFEEIIESLSNLESSGLDEFAESVMRLVRSFPVKDSYTAGDLSQLLAAGDFETWLTVCRLFLGKSNDEFQILLRERSGGRTMGVQAFRRDPDAYARLLGELGVIDAINHLVHRPVTWQDILIERLIGGRGRAIKGQRRGRALEDFTEAVVRRVFGRDRYHARCRFLGRTGLSTEKADFAIPDRHEPRILIESKAYGATGSKQTDIIGDMTRIVEQKRHDTTLLLMTDGITWTRRANDLRKLVEMQNLGYIARIYTCGMAGELEKDLLRLKSDHQL